MSESLPMHGTSLPSPYGIGDVDPGAVARVDRLREAGQRWWVPLGSTAYGDSPYQSLSSFAGDPLLISPDWLIEDELLKPRLRDLTRPRPGPVRRSATSGLMTYLRCCHRR